MNTIHKEARELYKRIARRYKTHPDPLDRDVLALLAKVIPMIPEAKPKAKGLNPLHRELILGFQESIRTDRRDKAECTAWAKIAAIVTPEDVALLKRFYRLKKPSEYVEFLSSRVKAVDTLMNSYTKQLEYAEAYFKANPRAGMARAKPSQPKEPEGWAKRAPGALGEKTWDRVCIEYPDIAKQLIAGEDLA